MAIIAMAGKEVRKLRNTLESFSILSVFYIFYFEQYPTFF